MKHTGIVAVVFIVGCATGGVAAQLVIPPVHAGAAPIRWEYQCLNVPAGDGGVTLTLNRYGLEGWELVSMAPTNARPEFGVYRVDAYTLCTKRAMP